MEPRTEVRRNLEQRLRDLELPLPPSLRVAALVAASRPRILPFPGAEPARSRVARRARRGVVAAVLMAGLNLLALQVWPSYHRVLADTPIIGPTTVALLSDLGLGSSISSPAPSPLAVSAGKGGVRVTLVAGYADAIRTIVVMKTSPAFAPFFSGPDQPTLTDQSGQTVAGLPGAYLSGHQVLVFPPFSVAGSDSSRRLTLTLTVPALYAPWGKSPRMVHVAGYPAGTKGEYPAPVVVGPWHLSFHLTTVGGTKLPLPADQAVGGTTYTITSLVESTPFLDIAWSVSGAAVAAANAHPTSSQLTSAVLGEEQLYSPRGQAITAIAESGSLPASASRATLEGIFALSGKGTYRLVMGANPSVTFTIPVP